MGLLSRDHGIVKTSSGLLTVIRAPQVYLAGINSRQEHISMSQYVKESTTQPRSGRFLSRLVLVFSLLVLPAATAALTTITLIPSSASTLRSMVTQQEERLHQWLRSSSTITKCILSD